MNLCPCFLHYVSLKPLLLICPETVYWLLPIPFLDFSNAMLATQCLPVINGAYFPYMNRYNRRHGFYIIYYHAFGQSNSIQGTYCL